MAGFLEQAVIAAGAGFDSEVGQANECEFVLLRYLTADLLDHHFTVSGFSGGSYQPQYFFHNNSKWQADYSGKRYEINALHLCFAKRIPGTGGMVLLDVLT